MLLGIFNLENSSALSIAGSLATINTIIVEVLKNILPKKIPTKLVALISAILVTLGYTFLFNGISFQSFILSIFGGFLVAFISMFGFDTVKDIVEKFKSGGEKNAS